LATDTGGDSSSSGSDGEPSPGDEPTTTTDTSSTSTDGSSTSSEDSPSCGDGQVDFDEECDWGMGNGEEMGCTPTCEIAQCGDGFIQVGVEECDDGLDNSNAGACTSECLQARCGDDHLYEGVEQCDDGDTPIEGDTVINDDDAYGGCNTLCEEGPRCGDGTVQEMFEECDGGEKPDPSECSMECTVLTRVIFVSSEIYLGDLGGVEGGHQKCRDLATAAELSNPETFRAWLSGGGLSPLDWPVDSENRYQLPSGTVVAESWSQLISGNLTTYVNQTELKLPLEDGEPVSVWTGTLADGSSASSTCNGWTSELSGPKGRKGMTLFYDEGWTDFGEQKCNGDARLYCVEVW